ncbi:tyrosine-type recombinase/integrase [Thiomicrorhabdus sp. 6S2-11]|uniref:Tyrosine-type recombinase/integrase n=1 Tax=Thiomicrorhabdus marina TaxID=2818442 RepID=A0ABS3Q7U7_9GAMM|nr:integrase arm-type DNA-binding domain-containing protein [Thiomicrorhabdus marina]MBO1928430.1 tyrosine-type recombinase/integrase [Thiomicrorhabdus marina]
MQRKLTDVKVKNAKAKDKAYKLADGGGLYLFVTKAGAKSWRYDVKFNQKWITLTFGKYPAVGLSDARLQHEDARLKIELGIDPRQTKEAEAKLKPFSFYAKETIKTHDLKDTTIEKKLLKMQKHLFPALDGKAVEEVTAVDLLNILKPIADKGHRSLARDLAGYCRQTFNYLLSLQLVQNNPAATLAEILPKPKPSTNFHHLTDKHELALLLKGVDNYHGDAVVKYALQLMPLLALRPRNMRFMKWEYVDLKNALVTIPSAEMKASREHRLPLPVQAVAIFKELQKLTGNKELVFLTSHSSQKKAMSENTLNMALTRVVNPETNESFGKGFITSHGFRHTVSTFLNELGYNSDAIELQLAHASQDRIRATYNKAELLPERTKMMQEWADYLDGLKNGIHN